MCFKYHRLGHIAYKCSNKRVITLAEYQLGQEEEVKNEREICLMEEQEGEEVIAKPEEGEMLVIR